jgi:hypothetical protein
MDKITVIDMGFDDENELIIEHVSFVNEPATEIDFVKFAKEPEEIKFSVNEERMMVFGPTLVPGQLVRRIDQTTKQEVFWRFTAPQIEKGAHSLMMKGWRSGTTVDHDPKQYFEGAHIVESWVKWSMENDKSNLMGFKDLPVGSHFLGYKVTDPVLWEKVKSGEVKGLSIDGAARKIVEQKLEMMMEESTFLEDVNNLFAEASKLV